MLLHARAANLPDALIGVCSSGGDTDTVGAMVGCLAALRLGGDAIPPWMLAGLHGLDHLRDPERWEPVASERLLTQREEGHRREALLREMEQERARRRRAEPGPHAPWSLVDDAEAEPDELDVDADADAEDMDDDESFSDDPLSQLPEAPPEAATPAPLPPKPEPEPRGPARVEQLDLFGKPRT